MYSKEAGVRVDANILGTVIQYCILLQVQSDWIEQDIKEYHIDCICRISVISFIPHPIEASTIMGANKEHFHRVRPHKGDNAEKYTIQPVIQRLYGTVCQQHYNFWFSQLDLNQQNLLYRLLLESNYH